MHVVRSGFKAATVSFLVLSCPAGAAPVEQKNDVLQPIAGLLCDAKIQSMMGSLQAKRAEADKTSKSSKKSAIDGLASQAKLAEMTASIKALEGKIVSAAGSKLAGSAGTLSFLQSGKAGDSDAKQVSLLANQSCPASAKSGAKSESTSKDLMSLLTSYFSKKEKK